MQRYFAKDRLGDNLILQDSDLHHIKNVMRMKVDDEIEVIYDKILYICIVGDLSINEFSIVKRIDEDNDETHCEYKFKYCPNCGAKIKVV